MQVSFLTMSRSIISLLVFALLVAALLPIVHTSASPAPAKLQPCSTDAEFKPVPQLGRACRQPNGLWRVKLPNGTMLTTHGTDQIPPAPAAANDTVSVNATGPLTCAPAGTYRMLVIYAHAPGVASQYSARLGTIRSYIQEANNALTTESQPFGVTTSLRVACDGDGQVTVRDVALSTTAKDIGAIDSDLRSKGYNSSFEKYVVMYEQSGCGGGVAWLVYDDSNNVNNANNGGPGFAISWGFCNYGVVLHEYGHSMGAVQNSAPNTSGAGHCIDDQDVMCYNDGGPRAGQLHVACSDREHFDCNNNDYFHPNPPAGNYLATHWNTASCLNRFIVRSGCSGVTPTVTSVPRPPGSNLALGRGTSGSAACAANETANLAVDGQLGTKFCSLTAPLWLQVDLGASATINGFLVKHAGAGGETAAWNTHSFTIQTSSDNASWSTAVTVAGNTASQTTHTIAARTGRYVRLNVTTPTSDGNTAARIYELEVYGGWAPTPTVTSVPKPPGSNLALGRGTSGSAACAANETTNLAVDGALSTKFCSGAAPLWLQVDLGASATINGFLVKHAGAGGEAAAWNTHSFTIQTSSDNASWSTAVTVSGNTASQTTHTIAARTGRYVRLNISQGAQTGEANTARIYELEVYGALAPTPTRTNTMTVPTATRTRTNTATGPTATRTRTNTAPVATATRTRTNTTTAPTATRTRTNTTSTGYPAWAPNTSYAVGARVSYAGLNYQCLQAHTSLTGWEPPNTPALWQRI